MPKRRHRFGRVRERLPRCQDVRKRRPPSGNVDTRRTRLGHKEIKRPNPVMWINRFSSTEQPFKRLPWRIVMEIPLCRDAIPQNVRKSTPRFCTMLRSYAAVAASLRLASPATRKQGRHDVRTLLPKRSKGIATQVKNHGDDIVFAPRHESASNAGVGGRGATDTTASSDGRRRQSATDTTASSGERNRYGTDDA